jgi:CheY-like chemotaxis protein
MVPSHPLCHITIVIVEDHPDTRTLLSDFLTRLGARVITAGDAETALQEIQQCHPNVVLSDIGLPRTSGFELLDEIRLPIRLRLEPLQFNHDKSILRRFQSPMRVIVPARASDGRSIALTRNYPLCS